MNLRSLQRRVVRIEKDRKPRPSPFVIAYGSFHIFVERSWAEIRAGHLDEAEMLDVIEALRRWEEDGTWERAYELLPVSWTRG